MSELEQFSKLIGDIYDAALDPALWPEVLHATCDYVVGCAAMLNSQDFVTRSGQKIFSWGDNPEFTRSYFEKYIKINPMLPPFIMGAQPEQVLSIPELLPYDEFLGTRFYKEWVKAQSLVDTAILLLEKSALRFAIIAVARHERDGLVDAEARDRLTLLAPHFRRAVAIGNVVDVHKNEAMSLADTLDGLSSALFLVDADGRIRHANASGEAMLRAGTVVHAPMAKLAAVDLHGNESLRESISAAALGDGVKKRTGANLTLVGRDGDNHIVDVLSLMGGARRQAGTDYSAVAAVFVRKAEFELPHPLEALAKHYKLTAAEMRVLLATVEGGGVAEVSRTLGISGATVKTHLQRLFGKTGANRQAELVKLVAGFMSPLGG